MASPESDPEKYSIDEMMERLKSRAPEEPSSAGELVIRDDGTAAIRVRKRKRRSSQPKKEEARRSRRALIFQISGILVLLILAGLAIGGGIVFANSVPYRNSLVKKVAAATGASVDLQLFRMNPTNAYADSMSLDWPEGHILGDLKLRVLKAEIRPSSFLGKTFTGEDVTASDGVLRLYAPQGKPPGPGEGSEGEPTLRFNRYGVNKLDVFFGDPTEGSGRLTGTEASFYATTVSGHPQLRLHRGDLAFEGWPTLQVDRGLIEFRGGEIGIVGLKLSSESDRRGQLDLVGTVQPFDPDRPSTLKLTASSFPMAGIVGPVLGNLISGRIDTDPEAQSNSLSFAPGPNPAATLSLSFTGSLDSGMEMKQFPFLFGLAQSLNDDWFERPVFSSDASGTIRRAAGVVRLADLSLLTRGRMAVKGDIAMDRSGLLSGVIEVGLTEGIVAGAPSRRLAALFGGSREGFRWMKLAISGTAESPADDFQEQYNTLEREASGVSSPGATFEELTRPR